ncbi:hypothetical protein [Zavarzinia aquatilis]|nr:hypothetical protein [Zavarzinia aquatilis]
MVINSRDCGRIVVSRAADVADLRDFGFRWFDNRFQGAGGFAVPLSRQSAKGVLAFDEVEPALDVTLRAEATLAMDDPGFSIGPTIISVGRDMREHFRDRLTGLEITLFRADCWGGEEPLTPKTVSQALAVVTENAPSARPHGKARLSLTATLGTRYGRIIFRRPLLDRLTKHVFVRVVWPT